MSRRRLYLWCFLAATFLSSLQLQACPVCFAAPESPESRGMTMAILFLLGTVGVVLCGIGSFVFYLMARQKEPMPHAELFADQQPFHH